MELCFNVCIVELEQALALCFSKDSCLTNQRLAHGHQTNFQKLTNMFILYRNSIPVFFVSSFVCSVSVFRSCHQSCSVNKGVLKNFAKFAGKLCQSLFSDKIAGARTSFFNRKRLDDYFSIFYPRCFLSNVFFQLSLSVA